MKLNLETVANWTLLLAVLITTHLSAAQLEPFSRDLITLCVKSNSLDCKWLLDAYRSQIFLPITADVDPKYAAVRYRSIILPRHAIYDDGSNTYQLPSVSGWKNQHDREISKGTNTNDLRIRSRQLYNNDNTNKRTALNFSSWGGKRSYGPEVLGDNNLANTKREPNFSSWGGKRTQKFFNWGGKRNIPVITAADDSNNELLSKTYDHQIAKRQVDQNEPIKMMSKGISTNESREKRLCMNELPTHWQDLFKEFVEWSRKQPEQKKGSIYRKVFGINTLHSPENLTRRAGSFYPWGGKRNSKQN